MANDSENWTGKAAAIAGAAIGSAAIAAALMFINRRKAGEDTETRFLPKHPQDAPETD